MFIPHLMRVGNEPSKVGRQVQESESAIADTIRVSDEFSQSTWQAMFNEGPPNGANNDLERCLARLERNGQRSSGEDGKNARAGIGALRFMQPQIVAYNQAMEQLNDSVGLDPADVNSTTDLDRARRELRAFRSAADKLIISLKAAPARFTSELAAEQEFRDAADLELQQRIHATEIIACDCKRKLYDMLRRE